MLNVLAITLILLVNAYLIPRNIKNYREKHDFMHLVIIGLAVLSLVIGVANCFAAF